MKERNRGPFYETPCSANDLDHDRDLNNNAALS